MVWRHYTSRNYLVIVHVHVRYALLIKNFTQFRSQDLKHTETGPFSLLHPGTIELPLDLRSLDTINLFKKHLKTDLFEKSI